MRSDLYTGGIIMLAALGMFYEASCLPTGMFGTLGAGFFPKIVFGLLAVFACIQTLKNFFNIYIRKNNKVQSQSFNIQTYQIVVVAFLLFFGFVIVMKYFGFVIASLVFLPTLMWILGPKTVKSLIPISLTTIAITSVIYIGFTKCLNVFLPSGSFF